MVAVAAAVGCSQHNASSTESSVNLMAPTSLASSTGGTVKETLTGPAIGGVVPEGQALADQSQYLTGGSTTLTVQVKNVKLADGTVLPVSLDFTNVGSIAVSRDQVRVLNNGATILSGGFFQ